MAEFRPLVKGHGCTIRLITADRSDQRQTLNRSAIKWKQARNLKTNHSWEQRSPSARPPWQAISQLEQDQAPIPILPHRANETLLNMRVLKAFKECGISLGNLIRMICSCFHSTISCSHDNDALKMENNSKTCTLNLVLKSLRSQTPKCHCRVKRS